MARAEGNHAIVGLAGAEPWLQLDTDGEPRSPSAPGRSTPGSAVAGTSRPHDAARVTGGSHLEDPGLRGRVVLEAQPARHRRLVDQHGPGLGSGSARRAGVRLLQESSGHSAGMEQDSEPRRLPMSLVTCSTSAGPRARGHAAGVDVVSRLTPSGQVTRRRRRVRGGSRISGMCKPPAARPRS